MMSGLLPKAEDGYIHYMASQILRVSEHRTASAPHNEPLVPHRHLCNAPKEDLSSYPYYTCNISRYYLLPRGIYSTMHVHQCIMMNPVP